MMPPYPTCMKNFILAVGAIAIVVVGCSSGNGSNDGGTNDGSNNNDSATNDASTKDSATTDAPTDSGCSASVGSATVTGTLLGNTLAAKDSISNPGNGTPYVIITDYANACSVGLNNIKKNSSGLLFDFLTTSTIAVGTVNVGADLDVQYATYDATCQSNTGESSTSGSVTITKADSCAIQGTFDVTLSNDHVTGSFTAPNCASPPSDAGQGCL